MGMWYSKKNKIPSTSLPRIGLVFNSNPDTGGGFSFQNSFINYSKKNSAGNYELVEIINSEDSWFNRVKQLGPLSFQIPNSIPMKIRGLIELSLFLSTILTRIGLEKSFFEKFCKKNRIDCLIFLNLNPNILLIKNIPVVSMIWDVGHRELYFLEEFAKKNNVAVREFIFRNYLPKSIFTVTDSELTSQNLVRLYDLDPSQLISVGLLPEDPPKIIDKINYEMKSDLNNYFLYPAQFWSHKNHKILLKAFKEFCIENKDVNLVLTGADKGTFFKVSQLIKQLNLTKRVINLGFVDRGLYWTLLENSIGLVYPSILGPTNLPPLEAFMLGKPMAISDFHKNMFQEGLINIEYFNPLEVSEISSALKKLLKMPRGPKVSFEDFNNNQVGDMYEKLTRKLSYLN